ncbi:MAG: Protoporphyrinogen oxidase/Dehydrogenase (flavoprotein) [Verrucomicrobia bacterium]|jgi:protoporphyrinogen oxidase|nr:MAG: Protoporphyrinogen oxidase/Dehydrogenase (flavoprotein) [Verrucomicrobiota bacterium]
MPLAESTRQRVVVLGGGISGLTAARELATKGHAVTVLESGDRWGGLGTWFDWNGHSLDQFYHCQMPSDDDLLQLIRDIGLGDSLYWKPTRMGFVVGGKRYAFNGPMDLLRFDPLTFPERIRFGVVSLLLRRLGFGRDLDRTRIEDWLVSCYGRPVWEKILRPLFTSKFGPAAGDMPALYIWERLGREKNTVSRGYLRGGLRTFLDTLVENLRSLGVDLRLETRAGTIRETGDGVEIDAGSALIEADWCVSTLPLPVLRNCLGDTPLAQRIRTPDVPYQGVVNAMFFLRRPLDNYYWAPVVDSGTEFDGIVEMTELVETSHYGGHHVAYVMKYCDRSSPLFLEDPGQIAARWTQQLLALYPDLNLQASDIADVRVFKAPFVEPAYPLGYSELKPLIHDGESRLFLATSAQVYPKITAWNSSVRLAKEVARRLLDHMETVPRTKRTARLPATVQV